MAPTQSKPVSPLFDGLMFLFLGDWCDGVHAGLMMAASKAILPNGGSIITGTVDEKLPGQADYVLALSCRSDGDYRRDETKFVDARMEPGVCLTLAQRVAVKMAHFDQDGKRRELPKGQPTFVTIGNIEEASKAHRRQIEEAFIRVMVNPPPVARENTPGPLNGTIASEKDMTDLGAGLKRKGGVFEQEQRASETKAAKMLKMGELRKKGKKVPPKQDLEDGEIDESNEEEGEVRVEEGRRMTAGAGKSSREEAEAVPLEKPGSPGKGGEGRVAGTGESSAAGTRTFVHLLHPYRLVPARPHAVIVELHRRRPPAGPSTARRPLLGAPCRDQLGDRSAPCRDQPGLHSAPRRERPTRRSASGNSPASRAEAPGDAAPEGVVPAMGLQGGNGLGCHHFEFPVAGLVVRGDRHQARIFAGVKIFLGVGVSWQTCAMLRNISSIVPLTRPEEARTIVVAAFKQGDEYELVDRDLKEYLGKGKGYQEDFDVSYCTGSVVAEDWLVECITKGRSVGQGGYSVRSY